MNPFLSPLKTLHETFPFNELKNDHFLPAIEKGIIEGKSGIQKIIDNKELPSFENTIEALENVGELIENVSSVFFNMHEAETNEELESLAEIISPKLSEYGNDIILNNDLFIKVETVYNQKGSLVLTNEQQTLLEKTYKGFVRNGAKLNDKEKEEVRAIDKELSTSTLLFGQHVLAESNDFVLYLTDKSELSGLPDGTIEAASITAKEKGHSEGWCFTLDYPSYVPFMTYADDRSLRKIMFLAFGSKAFKGNDRDNSQVIKHISSLRHKRALILGYNSHADFVLEERMAKNPSTVIHFLTELRECALPFAKKEFAELVLFSKSIGGPDDLMRWDITYYAEKLKKEKFNIDDEVLKPYFKLENVIQGVFTTSEKLYGLTFKENNEIQKYHPEVSCYEVYDKNSEFLSVLYTDFFPRSGKRQGAWMTSFKNQKIKYGTNLRPHISIVCNFTKPTDKKPSLLTFNEVTTLFHEFGHALHGMCANTKYGSLSGTNVFWDFVELPSQIFENWCYEKECLDLFATHYETGESIPVEFIEKIKESANFQSGLTTIRQLAFSFLDIAWHSQDNINISDIKSFEVNATQSCDLYPIVAEISSSCSFSHIFQGGYSSGYYSYKWAEVIEADAFEAFKEAGIFNQEVAHTFFNNILSQGGSEHPSILYRKFRGRDADPKALLRREGLLTN